MYNNNNNNKPLRTCKSRDRSHRHVPWRGQTQRRPYRATPGRVEGERSSASQHWAGRARSDFPGAGMFYAFPGRRLRGRRHLRKPPSRRRNICVLYLSAYFKKIEGCLLSLQIMWLKTTLRSRFSSIGLGGSTGGGSRYSVRSLGKPVGNTTLSLGTESRTHNDEYGIRCSE